jgi:hypothetical protein
MHWLIIYNRRTSDCRIEECRDGADAMQARFGAERAFSDRPELEIVALGAASLDTIRRTHSRYFSGTVIGP